jgi:CubicO group peptidase (beta-lactamase class C family)
MPRRTSFPSRLVFLLTAFGLAAPSLAQQLPPPTFPGSAWEQRTPAELNMNAARLEEAKAYSLTRNGAGIITRNGYQVASWGKSTDRYPLFSVTKAVGALLLGHATRAHGITLESTAQSHYADFGAIPAENQASGFLDDVTIEQLATHSAGFEKTGDAPRLKFEPGRQWVYSDGGANWLADVLTNKYQEDLRSVLKREFLDHLGITLRIAVTGPSVGMLEWRDARSTVRPKTIGAIPRREFNAGISASVDAMARIGLLVERKGVWNGTEIVPAAFIERMVQPAASIAGLPIMNTGGAPDAHFPSATEHHGLFWWNNADGALPSVPRDAHWAWGLGDHLIVVIPSLGIVAARTSGQAPEGELLNNPNPWKNADPLCASEMCAHYDALDPFLTPIAQSIESPAPGNARPEVNAGADVTIDPPTLEVTLTGTATDDGNPSGSTLATTWSVGGGTGATIATPNALTTVVAFAGPGTYTLRLTATDGNLSASDDVVVTVTGAPAGAPAVTISANPTTVTTGGSSTLNWSATNADSCTASNGWTGAKAVTGTESVTVAQTSTYTLACTGTGGTTEASVTVTANAPAPAPTPDPPADSGGGGGAVQWWMLLALAALSGLRRVFAAARRREPAFA